MTTPPPNDFPRELLAAYADGELDEAARAAVERWLAVNPGAADDLRAQHDLSPANAALWERADPPQPSEARWEAARREVTRRVAAPEPLRRWRAGLWAAAGLAAAGVAAAVAWVAFRAGEPAPAPDAPARPELAARPAAAPAPREAGPAADDPLAGFAVLPMASDDDVVLDRVPEFPAGWLPVGRHPLQGVVTLASEQELVVAEFAPSPAWPTGGPKMTTGPGDAPMIYAGKLR